MRSNTKLLYKDFQIRRFPSSSNKSLKAFSAADELMMQYALEELNENSKTAIINDRFGFLSLHLTNRATMIYTHYKSQEDAIRSNFQLNGHDPNIPMNDLLSAQSEQADLVLIKIPKSMDLFHLFLKKAYALCQSNGKVICGFMTRHFTPQMLDIASKYFTDVQQTKAWKKARVLMLSAPKEEVASATLIHKIDYTNHRDETTTLQQYYGVFSARHIDYATDFLLRKLELRSIPNRVLDLASGNGIIAREIRHQFPESEIHLMDDSFLAIESSRLNLNNGNNHFHYQYNLDHFADKYFDLVISNPPFHFEHENTIEIALTLFEGVARTLDKEGRFILVANRHLNYKSHLERLFREVYTTNENSKFEIIECKNPLC